ncbi:MAG: hypothetical protein WCC17_04940 [Candidatus Nitrosopolaris sp.]
MASQAQGMISQAKSVIPTNATSTTKLAITKKHLSQLKNTIDSIDPYDKVASLVQKTIYPDLDAEPLYLILGNILNKSNA